MYLKVASIVDYWQKSAREGIEAADDTPGLIAAVEAGAPVQESLPRAGRSMTDRSIR